MTPDERNIRQRRPIGVRNVGEALPAAWFLRVFQHAVDVKHLQERPCDGSPCQASVPHLNTTYRADREERAERTVGGKPTSRPHAASARCDGRTPRATDGGQWLL